MSRETKTSLVLGISIIIGFGVALAQLRPSAPAGAGDAGRFTSYSLSPAVDQPLPAFDRLRRAAPTAVAPSRNVNVAEVAPRRTYAVRRNDSLTRIAQRVYGRGNVKYYRLIYEANRAILPDERTLRAGQILVIPPLSSAGTSSIARRRQRPDGSVAFGGRER